MNFKQYVWCVVGDCKSTSNNTPGKLFIKVPDDLKMRNMWLRQAGKDPDLLIKNKLIYFCEDHFNLPNDMENYREYSITKSVECIRMKTNCIPSRFNCQSVRKLRKRKQLSSHLQRFDFIQKQRMPQHPRASSNAGRQQVSRHLRKGVVPSIFPWTKKSSTSASVTTPREETACSPRKKHVLRKSAPVTPQLVHEEQPNKPTEDTKLLRDRSVRLKNRKAYLANRKCSISQCNARPSKEISLHPCPNNAAVRTEWAEALRVSYQYIKSMVICSLHFSKTDFIQSKHSGEQVLKQNAVPSRNLPNRKRVAVPVKNKPLKKPLPCKDIEREKTMTDNDGVNEAEQETESRECRACLTKLDDKKSCCYVFQAWAPPWKGMEATIAEDLAKLANVEISITDRHSKVICAPCYKKLLDAATFASSVRGCDLFLRQRYTSEIDIERVWPKPIQVDKNIDGSVFNNTMDIEIKQEVVSDEEVNASGTDNAYVDTELPNLDIKIEPEEIVEPPPMNITINGTISLDPLNLENKKLTNGPEEHQEDNLLETKVKQEPLSEEEQEPELAPDLPPDLPLECLLCTKSFNSVTGLKAHVIAQHSYKSVKRKSDGSLSPERKRTDKYHCAICRRSFLTSTDLMVHETCHNKHACYGCTEKFDSFDLLIRHRKRCKANIANSVSKLKTLEDVKRSLPEEKEEYLEIEKREPENTINEAHIEMLEADNKKISENDMKETEGLKDLENNMQESENVIKETKNIANGNKELIQEHSDSSMKLHLEIHSRKTEATEISDGDLQIETIKNDDCT